MKISQLPIVRKGSAKNIRRFGADSLVFEFLDHISAFDVGQCPQAIPGKARSICKAAIRSFQIAQMLGIPTCFIEQLTETAIRVKEFATITDRPLTRKDRNCLIPAEWIFRFRVSGSLLRGFQSGKKKPTDYGFPTDVVPSEGTSLRMPVSMFTTKWEKTDREISHEDALALCGMNPEEAAIAWSMIHRLAGGVSLVMEAAGFVHFDGKMELGFGEGREIVVLDVFGTQDEDRPVLAKALTEGRMEHYGKEFPRQFLIDSGYKKAVDEARAAKRSDPSYPTFPPDVIAEINTRYDTFADRYTRVPLSV